MRQALLAGFLLLGTGGTAWAHEGGLGNEAMWQACEGRKVDDRCAFQSVDHDVYRGSCQAMTNALVCVRNQPIERAAISSLPHQHEDDPGATRDAVHQWPWLAGCSLLLVGGLVLFRMGRRSSAQR